VRLNLISLVPRNLPQDLRTSRVMGDLSLAVWVVGYCMLRRFSLVLIWECHQETSARERESEAERQRNFHQEI